MATSNQSGSTGTQANPSSSPKKNAKKSGVSSKLPRTPFLPESRNTGITRSKTSVTRVDYENLAYENSEWDSGRESSSKVSAQFSDRNRDRNGKGSGIKSRFVKEKKDGSKSATQWKPNKSLEADCRGTSSHNNKGKECGNQSEEEEKERKNVQGRNASDSGYGSIAGSEQGDAISEKLVTQGSGKESEVKSKEKMGGDSKTAPHVQSVRTKHSDYSSQEKGDKNSLAAQVSKKSYGSQMTSSLDAEGGLRLKSVDQDRTKRRRIPQDAKAKCSGTKSVVKSEDKTSGDGLRLKALCQDRTKNQRMLPHANTEYSKEDTLETKKSIGKSGGEISLGGCKVNFYQETLAQNTSVVTKVYSNPGIHCPPLDPEYFSVTPVLDCHVSTEMHGLAEIQMQSFCFVEEGSERMEAHVLHLKTGSLKWEVFKKIEITHKSEFCFTTNSFSSFVVVVPSFILALLSFKLRGHIAATKRDNFRMDFYFKSSMLKNDLEQHLVVPQYKLVYSFDTIVVKYRSKIVAQLECPSETFKFPAPFKFEFLIDSNYLRVKRKTLDSYLVWDATNTNENIDLKSEVRRNDKLVDGPRHFSHERVSDTSEQQIPGGEIQHTTTTVLRGIPKVETLHVGETGAHYDNRNFESFHETKQRGLRRRTNRNSNGRSSRHGYEDLENHTRDDSDEVGTGCCGGRRKKKKNRLRSARTTRRGRRANNIQNRYDESSNVVELEDLLRETVPPPGRKKKWYDHCSIL